ncbi:hypothetical protein [Sphingomonas sp. Leaf205]|uniref:hypothetical protein n=1 Tax=Sphingomonas sp. Leaf205 TaxID=2876551 RepID=UPI001E466C21|nr:hypothetical protein [Sphingomonas sp. Leaf205]
MSNFSSSDREVIRFLFSKRNWVDLYDLHVELGLSPAQITDMLERLLALGLAERQGAEARLTQQGRDWTLAARGDIFFDIDREGWRPTSDQLLVDGLKLSTPYMPDLGLIDRSFFIQLALGKQSDDVKV